MRPSYFFLLAVCVFASPALAKNEQSKEPADKKHVLLDQIVEAVKAEKLTEEEKADFKKRSQERLDRFIDVVADKTKMSPEDKQKLKDKLSKSCQENQANGLPPEVKERIESQLAIKEFGRDLSYQVLGDHLDDSDLKAILKFIKSSTGKKLIKQAPDMIAQMIELSAERYVPLAIDMMKQFKVPDGIGSGPPKISPEQKRELMEKIRRLLQNNRQPSAPGKDET